MGAKKHRRPSQLVPRPRTGTPAGRDFLLSWHQINGFYEFVMGTVGQVEGMHQLIHDRLMERLKDEQQKKQREDEFRSRQGAFAELTRHRQIFCEVILTRHVDNYLNYLSALLFEIFTQRPETLRSREVIEVATVLSHSSIPELVRSIAERKVLSLSYKSFNELCDFFDRRFGLTVVAAVDSHLILEAIETRNISVHNRCLVNERYIQRTGADRSLLGMRRDLFVQRVEEIIGRFPRNVIRLDRDARKKLGLKATRFDMHSLLPPIPSPPVL